MAITPVTTAAFVQAIRRFATQTPDWASAIRYQTLPDERGDLMLAARRAYGDYTQYMVIFAAAGLDTLEQVMPEQILVLPNYTQLQLIKRQTNYLTDDEAAAYSAID
jgi:hypothetical protein